MAVLSPKPNFNCIGHRGACALAPENTYTSFKLAKENHLNWVEFDVQLTKDNHWIVIHDNRLERTTSGTGYVNDVTLEYAQNLQAGKWYTPPFEDEKIPTLSQLLELLHEIELFPNIEVKGPLEHTERYVEQFVKFINKHPLFTNPLVSSFNLEFLIGLRREMPQIQIGYLVDKFTPTCIDTVHENHFTTLHCDQDFLLEEHVKLANDNKIPMLAFTVKDRLRAQQLLDWGVSALFVNDPCLMQG